MIAAIAAITEKHYFIDCSDPYGITLQRSYRSQRSQRQRSLIGKLLINPGGVLNKNGGGARRKILKTLKGTRISFCGRSPK